MSTGTFLPRKAIKNLYKAWEILSNSRKIPMEVIFVTAQRQWLSSSNDLFMLLSLDHLHCIVSEKLEEEIFSVCLNM